MKPTELFEYLNALLKKTKKSGMMALLDFYNLDRFEAILPSPHNHMHKIIKTGDEDSLWLVGVTWV